MKYALIGLLAALLTACGDGDSDKSTYNTCRITDSDVIFASDHAHDVAQCWNIHPTKDKTNALSQCNVLVSKYMSDRYVTNQGVTYMVSSSSCP